MALANELRLGSTVRLEGGSSGWWRPCPIREAPSSFAICAPGLWWSAASAQEIQEVELERRPMEYLYTDGEAFYFMDLETYDQVSIRDLPSAQSARSRGVLWRKPGFRGFFRS